MQTAALSPAANPAYPTSITPGLAPAALAGGLPGATAGGADSFSRLLEAADARRQNEQADSPTPTATPAPPARAAAPAPQRATAQPAPPARPSQPTEDAPEQATAGQATAAAPEEAAAEAGSEATAPADAAALLASLGWTMGPQAALATARGRAPATGEAREGGLGLADGGGDLPATAGPTTTGRRLGGAPIAPGDEGHRAGPAFAGLLAQAASPEADTAKAAWAASPQVLAAPATLGADLRPADNGALLMAAASPIGPTALPGSSPANPAEARLSHAPGNPAFAEELGTQITTFVREGVQHAKLQLNPLELGPVTVQIQLDGGSAHMSFAAEHAATRQALEQALPTLAGSLREAGLTLSGGGVFEQPRQQAQAEPGSGGNGRSGTGGGTGESGSDTAPGAAAATGNGMAGARRRGVVDLVA
ncbi:flagellar hook-length control protein FliK [Rubrivivax rivuli]|uniref:Flagellar hook-length control protein FliK n=1 Tax=Rubrivivax rivuli TaxID=1862385 RepID=A0A437R8A5_9BURK|nr:flagellar hook-length control protein FliK [Rubrivivax rivuli]RVU43026.1 flagellar hook-length control protein FliK [Rubrivivax rivuli]